MYDANRLASGEIDPANPVSAYWILNAKQGQRQELSSFERSRAYGVDVRKRQKHPSFHMGTKLGRSFVVEIHNGCPIATTRINGHRAIVHKVFVQATTKMFIPSVDWVEITGNDLHTGAPVQEKFKP